jgi:hypothetical protein
MRHNGPFWNLALGGGEWSASRLDRFTPLEKRPGAHWAVPQIRSGLRGIDKNVLNLV